jgi:hypothetical protein
MKSLGLRLAATSDTTRPVGEADGVMQARFKSCGIHSSQLKPLKRFENLKLYGFDECELALVWGLLALPT